MEQVYSGICEIGLLVTPLFELLSGGQLKKSKFNQQSFGAT